tara:strand:- start:1104 stop:1709 length:606 start_codon:yes stop_codon:yes gene_type:complete
MKRIFSWLTKGALIVGLVLGPSVAWGAFNIKQGANFDTWFENSLGERWDSLRQLYFDRLNYIQIRDANNAIVGELTSKEYVFTIADLGTAASHYLVVPTTGTIWRIDAVPNSVLAGAATVVRLYADNIDGLGAYQATAANYTDNRVSAMTVTMSAGGAPGVQYTDDTIFHAVNLNDVIAIETDGGTTATVIGHITIHIRME